MSDPTIPPPTDDDRLSNEQMVRNLLTRAISEGVVRRPKASDFGSGDPDPQARTAGDLCGTANLLQSYLRREVAACRAELPAWLKVLMPHLTTPPTCGCTYEIVCAERVVRAVKDAAGVK